MYVCLVIIDKKFRKIVRKVLKGTKYLFYHIFELLCLGMSMTDKPVFGKKPLEICRWSVPKVLKCTKYFFIRAMYPQRATALNMALQKMLNDNDFGSRILKIGINGHLWSVAKCFRQIQL